jgi:hypothetical protein
MFLGLFSPETSLQMNFGEPLLTGPESVVVRGWSALIGIMGIMLIIGAFKTSLRSFTLIIVGVSKVVFVALILLFGSQYLSFGIGNAIIVDLVMILLFILYLINSNSKKEGRFVE